MIYEMDTTRYIIIGVVIMVVFFVPVLVSMLVVSHKIRKKNEQGR